MEGNNSPYGTLWIADVAFVLRIAIEAFIHVPKVKLPDVIVASEKVAGKQGLGFAVVGHEVPRTMSVRDHYEL